VKLGTALSVDDNEDDQFLLQMAWEKGAVPLHLQMVCDGEKAIEYLGGLENYGDRERFPMPDIILLDLKMPRKNGFEVLDWMNRELPAERPPVAVFTSSQDTSDIRRAYELGAKWFLAKPVDYTDLTQWVQLIGRWFQNPQENDLSISLHYRAPRLPRTD
jgi:CheY-like chemotaxis protein